MEWTFLGLLFPDVSGLVTLFLDFALAFFMAAFLWACWAKMFTCNCKSILMGSTLIVLIYQSLAKIVEDAKKIAGDWEFVKKRPRAGGGITPVSKTFLIANYCYSDIGSPCSPVTEVTASNRPRSHNIFSPGQGPGNRLAGTTWHEVSNPDCKTMISTTWLCSYTGHTSVCLIPVCGAWVFGAGRDNG